jgi:hypothetical protein
MAKVIVSTDRGEVEETFIDEDGELGSLERAGALDFLADLKRAIDRARRKDGRRSDGEPTK